MTINILILIRRDGNVGVRKYARAPFAALMAV